MCQFRDTLHTYASWYSISRQHYIGPMSIVHWTITSANLKDMNTLLEVATNVYIHNFTDLIICYFWNITNAIGEQPEDARWRNR